LAIEDQKRAPILTISSKRLRLTVRSTCPVFSGGKFVLYLGALFPICGDSTDHSITSPPSHHRATYLPFLVPQKTPELQKNRLFRFWLAVIVHQGVDYTLCLISFPEQFKNAMPDTESGMDGPEHHALILIWNILGFHTVAQRAKDAE
jgi:hypothetical protein